MHSTVPRRARLAGCGLALLLVGPSACGSPCASPTIDWSGGVPHSPESLRVCDGDPRAVHETSTCTTAEGETYDRYRTAYGFTTTYVFTPSGRLVGLVQEVDNHVCGTMTEGDVVTCASSTPWATLCDTDTRTPEDDTDTDGTGG